MNTATERPHVLIISHDLVGERMAGPGIRYWELARVLARTCQVTLAAPGEPPASSEVRVVPYGPGATEALRRAVAQAGVVLAYGYLLHDLPFLAELDVPLVLDLYIPGPAESLPLHAHQPLAWQEAQQRADLALLARIATAGDFFLCASDRQRDFWLGFLAAAGRLTPATFAHDSTLRSLIDVVPFGLPADPPRATSPLFKGVHPGIGPGDRLIVWGGGVWDWLDPLTLIRAVAQLASRRPDVRCVFPGAAHPWPGRVPGSSMLGRARALSDELGLSGRAVFWGDWVPYARRAGYLLEADVGVSLHQDSVESRLAFRTRILDYVWAGLPMVVSQGDVLAEEVAAAGLGHVVACGDAGGVAQALAALLDDPQARARRQAAFQAVAQRYAWPRVASPLVAFCASPRRDPCRDGAPQGICTELAGRLAHSEGQARELQALVAGYRRGRLMRLLARLEALRRRVRGAREAKP